MLPRVTPICCKSNVRVSGSDGGRAGLELDRARVGLGLGVRGLIVFRLGFEFRSG